MSESMWKAKSDFIGNKEENQLSFTKDEIVIITEKNNEEWFTGIVNGAKGLVPAKLVEKLENFNNSHKLFAMKDENNRNNNNNSEINSKQPRKRTLTSSYVQSEIQTRSRVAARIIKPELPTFDLSSSQSTNNTKNNAIKASVDAKNDSQENKMKANNQGKIDNSNETSESKINSNNSNTNDTNNNNNDSKNSNNIINSSNGDRKEEVKEIKEIEKEIENNSESDKENKGNDIKEEEEERPKLPARGAPFFIPPPPEISPAFPPRNDRMPIPPPLPPVFSRTKSNNILQIDLAKGVLLNRIHVKKGRQLRLFVVEDNKLQWKDPEKKKWENSISFSEIASIQKGNLSPTFQKFLKLSSDNCFTIFCTEGCEEKLIDLEAESNQFRDLIADSIQFSILEYKSIENLK